MAREYTRNLLILVGGIFFVVGIPFLCIGIWMGGDAANQKRLENEGAAATGIVLTKTRSSSSSSRSATTTTSYYVTYRFQTSSGQVIHGKSKVSRQAWDNITERQAIDVKYLPDAPEVSKIGAAAEDGFFPLIFTGLGGLATLIGLILLPIGLRQAYLARRLLRSGCPVEAIVEKIAESNFSSNGVVQMWLHYRYVDHQGQSRTGRSGYLTPEDASLWHPGDKGRARFDLKHPARSLWIGSE